MLKRTLVWLYASQLMVLLAHKTADTVPNEGMDELTFRPSWLSIAPESGDIYSDESLDLGVTFDAEGLYGGEYEATMEVYSNDP